MMKFAQLSILALLIVAGVIPLSSAQNSQGIQTGQAAIYCDPLNTENCDVEHMRGSILPYTAPYGSFTRATVYLFAAFSATGGPTQKNIMVTIEIQGGDLPQGRFVVSAMLGSTNQGTQIDLTTPLGGALLTNPVGPTEMTFAMLSVSRLSVALVGICTNTAAGCTANQHVIPPGGQYTISWQIQDPPGPAAVSLPFDLLAIVTVALAPAAAVYVVMKRRLPKKA